MRIALVTEFYYPTVGGIQEHVFHFARHARRAGHQVTIVTGAIRDLPPPPPEDERGVIRIGHSIQVRSNGSVGRVTVGSHLGRTLSTLLTKERFDLVHCHSPLSPVLPMIAPRNTDLPVIGTYHTNFPRSRLMEMFHKQCQWVVDRADVNVAVSEICIRAMEPYVNGRFRVIPNGVDCALWATGRRLPWARWPRAALFIGRLEARSGLDRVLRAWPLLPRHLGAELLVLGDGPERPEYERLASELRVPAHFLGPVRRGREDYFASVDLMICPTVIASFGVTLLEGMAAGLPIVASDIDGFREILTHDREGVLLDTAQPVLLAQSLQELFEDTSLRARYADAGRATAARYDWPKVTERVLDVYREVAA